MSLTAEQCEDFWAKADANGDGQLTIQELARAVRKYHSDISDKDCASMFCGLDKDGNKKITKQEFLEEMREKPKRGDRLCSLFKEYDANGDGTLSRDEVRKLIVECFKGKDPDEILEEFLKYTDTSGDGLVSLEEFRAFFG
ncbi:calmodulin-4-like [Mercenaria mercenaria]|uniref:calmodulin-4-like n=1 Tax=Mercenaria mercenaria TaxID=6596 RepID=UPI00234F9DBE|nr:calmodulin-4-like [Mercenaria mercenaria]XP_045169808.2 calmodulin-4-like [Mercenaria mercenaria]XP_045169809.2 calmodulin-4-like [Mercenaria mercenaria]XP_053374674.1 calmodulin-4-like [Mercenaria mercenaria]